MVPQCAVASSPFDDEFDDALISSIDEDALATPTPSGPSSQAPLCKFFGSSRGCMRGGACWFRHVLPEDAPSESAQHEGYLVSLPSPKYRCPKCDVPFAKWSACLKHLRTTGHVDVKSSMKGVQQRCSTGSTTHQKRKIDEQALQMEALVENTCSVNPMPPPTTATVDLMPLSTTATVENYKSMMRNKEIVPDLKAHLAMPVGHSTQKFLLVYCDRCPSVQSFIRRNDGFFCL